MGLSGRGAPCLYVSCPRADARGRARSPSRRSRAAGPDQGARHHHAEAVLRLQHRRRLPARHLRPVHRVLAEDRQGIEPDAGRSRSARPRKAGRISPRSSPRRRTSPSSIATSRSRSSCTARAASDRGAGAGAGEGRQGGRLDRRRPARHRSRRRASADRDDLPAGQPQRRRDDAHPARRHHHRRARQSRRHADGRRSATCRTRIRCSARTCSPRLYNKYAGHDDNRDFYMSNLKESQNMNKLMYWEWLPQIMYNHHQTGPAGTVIFSPPFRDPFNYNFDPMIVTGLDMVGARDAPPLPAGRQAGLHDALGLDATRRGGTAACGRRPTSRTSSACSPRSSATRRRRRSRRRRA